MAEETKNVVDKKKKEKDKAINPDDYVDTKPTVDEAMTVAQRRAIGRSMRRNKSKIAMGRKRAAKRKAPLEKLKKRAMKKARGMIRKKFLKTRSYDSLSPAEKVSIDKRLERIPKAKMARLAKKLLPQVRKDELTRLKNARSKKVDEELAVMKEMFDVVLHEGISFSTFNDRMAVNESVTKTDSGYALINPDNANSILEYYDGDGVPMKEWVDSVTDTYTLFAPIISEELEEGKFLNFLRGFSDEEIAAKVDKLNDKQLKSIAFRVNPRNAKVQLSPKEYALWKAAVVKLGMWPTKESVLEDIREGKFIDFVKSKFQGWSMEDIKKSVDSMNGMQLKSVVLSYKPERAKIALKGKQYIFWKTAYDKFYGLTEEQQKCDIVSFRELRALERVIDKMFAKFGIDFTFTKHFGDRMGDERNTPCISLKELAALIKKIYKRQGKSLKDNKDAEVVLHDIQSDLNIPVVIEYDRKNDEIEVRLKTIMRKKNFGTSDKKIRY